MLQVITWGGDHFGGDSEHVKEHLQNVAKLNPGPLEIR